MADSDLKKDFGSTPPNITECPDIDYVLRQTALLKYREIITDTLGEYSRKGNFVRIYPAKNSYRYDQFFQGQRPLNKMLYRVLYS
jgi:hypothetical protein